MKKKRKLRKWVKVVLTAVGVTCALAVYIDFVRFPECYMPKFRYQLQNDLKSGDAEAIEYYQRYYVDKGRILFEE